MYCELLNLNLPELNNKTLEHSTTCTSWEPTHKDIVIVATYEITWACVTCHPVMFSPPGQHQQLHCWSSMIPPHSCPPSHDPLTLWDDIIMVTHTTIHLCYPLPSLRYQGFGMHCIKMRSPQQSWDAVWGQGPCCIVEVWLGWYWALSMAEMFWWPGTKESCCKMD